MNKKSFYVSAMVVCLVAVGAWHLGRSSKADENPPADLRNARRSQDLPETGREVKFTADSVASRTTGAVRMTPEMARERLSEIMANTPDITKKSAACADVISELCRNGYTNEAWDLIDSGYGTVRDSQLAAFFSGADLDNQSLLFKIEGLEKHEITLGMLGYLHRIKDDGMHDKLSSPEFQAFIDSLRAKNMLTGVDTALSVTLRTQLAESDASANRSLLESASLMNSSGLIGTYSMMDLVYRADIGDAFEKWEFVERIDPAEQENRRAQNVRVRLISELVRQDAAKALGTILQTPGKQGFADLSNAMEEWMSIDADGASKWVLANRPGLHQGKQNAVANALFTKALNFGEYDTARQWAESMHDPKMKANMMRALEARGAASQ